MDKEERKSLRTPDAFVKRGRAAMMYLAERRMSVLPLVIGVLVIALGAYVYDGWSGRKMEKAWEAYYSATKAAEPQRWDELKKMHAEWGRNRATYFASITLADHYFGEARKTALKGEAAKENPTNAAQAAEWYGKALAFPDLLPAEKQLVQINFGEALEIDGKYAEAQSAYQKAIDLGGDVKPYAELQLARAVQLNKDVKKAMEIYEKLAAESAESEYGKMAKNQLRLLKSPLYQQTGKL
jgi:tetratricopeptide (TPR) repeat protein